MAEVSCVGMFPAVAETGGTRRLAVPDGPVFAARVTLDWRTGRTRYRVAGPRITGSFVLSPDAPSDAFEIDPASYLIPRVDFGVPGEHRDPARYLDRPQVNGVTLYGSHRVPGWEDSVSAWRKPWCYMRRHDSPQDFREVPEATRLRTAQICHALITAWFAMPEWAALVRARLAHLAPAKLTDITAQIQDLYRRSTDLIVEIGRYEQAVGAWTALSSMPTVLTPEAAAWHDEGQEEDSGGTPAKVLLLDTDDSGKRDAQAPVR